MTCIRCQTIEAAKASGNESSLIDELYRQIERMQLQHERQLVALAARHAREHNERVMDKRKAK